MLRYPPIIRRRGGVGASQVGGRWEMAAADLTRLLRPATLSSPAKQEVQEQQLRKEHVGDMG